MSLKRRATNMTNYSLNYKVGNCLVKTLKHLIIIKYFQLNDHVFFNIHHFSVLRYLGSNSMTINTLIVLIHYMSIIIHCHAFHFKLDRTLYIRFRKFKLAYCCSIQFIWLIFTIKVKCRFSTIYTK